MRELIAEYSLAKLQDLPGGDALWGDFLRLDMVTQEHCGAVAEMSENIARAKGGSPGDMLDMRRAGLFHDIGKALISKRIVTKPSYLTDLEMMVMRTHTVLGEQLMRFCGIPYSLMLTACMGHHSLTGSPEYMVDSDPLVLLINLADIFETRRGQRLYPKPIESSVRIVESMHAEMIDDHKVTLDIWHMFLNGLESMGIV